MAARKEAYYNLPYYFLLAKYDLGAVLSDAFGKILYDLGIHFSILSELSSVLFALLPNRFYAVQVTLCLFYVVICKRLVFTVSCSYVKLAQPV